MISKGWQLVVSKMVRPSQSFQDQPSCVEAEVDVLREIDMRCRLTFDGARRGSRAVEVSKP